MKINYRILNPTGNITALVLSNVENKYMPFIAERIMSAESAVQQVGYVKDNPEYDICLTMAGGEFCGNATLSAAFLSAEKQNKGTHTILSSGSENPLIVEGFIENGVFSGHLQMPEIKSIKNMTFNFDGKDYILPTVELLGISHIIIADNEISKEIAYSAVRSWASALNCDALGIMFLDSKENTLSPLVYVATSNSLVWESSCASGSTAVAAFLSDNLKNNIDVTLKQPGGCLRVTVKNKAITLYGTVTAESIKNIEVLL